MSAILDKAIEIFNDNLRHDRVAQQYLRRRGLNAVRLINNPNFCVGVSRGDRDIKRMRSYKIRLKDLVEAGLVAYNKPFFKNNYLVFPTIIHGECKFIYGRAIYNTPKSHLNLKRRILYMYNCDNISQQASSVYLVEGIIAVETNIDLTQLELKAVDAYQRGTKRISKIDKNQEKEAFSIVFGDISF